MSAHWGPGYVVALVVSLLARSLLRHHMFDLDCRRRAGHGPAEAVGPRALAPVADRDRLCARLAAGRCGDARLEGAAIRPWSASTARRRARGGVGGRRAARACLSRAVLVVAGLGRCGAAAAGGARCA